MSHLSNSFEVLNAVLTKFPLSPDFSFCLQPTKIIFQLLQDEHYLKTLSTCADLLDQGYESKVRRILARASGGGSGSNDGGDGGSSSESLPSLTPLGLEAEAEKVRARVEKARASLARTEEKVAAAAAAAAEEEVRVRLKEEYAEFVEWRKTANVF